jgi:hypothetical protein
MILGKNYAEHRMRVLIFSTNFVWNILREIPPITIRNGHTSSCEVPLFLSDFNETWTFLTDFRKNLKYKIS